MDSDPQDNTPEGEALDNFGKTPQPENVEGTYQSLSQSFQTVGADKAGYFCSIHPEKTIEFRTSTEFLCALCMFEREITKKTASVFDHKEIASSSVQLKDQLVSIKEKLEMQIQNLEEIAKPTGALHSQHIFECFKTAEEFIHVNTHGGVPVAVIDPNIGQHALDQQPNQDQVA